MINESLENGNGDDIIDRLRFERRGAIPYAFDHGLTHRFPTTQFLALHADSSVMSTRSWPLLSLLLLLLAALVVSAATPSGATQTDDLWDLSFIPASLHHDPTTGLTMASTGPYADTTLHGLDSNGAIVWTIDGLPLNAPVLHDGSVYTTFRDSEGDHTIRAYAMATGALINEWSVPGEPYALQASTGSLWFNHTISVDFVRRSTTIARIDVTTGAFEPEVIAVDDLSISLAGVLDNGTAAFVSEGNELVRYDLTGFAPAATHRAPTQARLSIESQKLVSSVAGSLLVMSTDDLSIERSILDQEQMFQDFADLGNNRILGAPYPTPSHRVGVADLEAGTVLGRALPRPQNWQGRSFAHNGRIAVVTDYSGRVEFYDIRLSTNASDVTGLEAGAEREIELTGDYLASTTAISIGGVPASFTINPSEAPFAGWTPRPASLTVTVPDLGVGTHLVSVQGTVASSIDRAENQLRIVPALPRRTFDILLRSDSVGEEVTVWAACVDADGLPDFNANRVLLQRGALISFDAVVGQECTLQAQRDDTQIGGWENHITTGFFNPKFDPTGLSTIDLETHSVEFTMPAEDVGIAIYLPSFEQRVLWTYAYGVGTPGTGTRTVTIDCPGTANDDAYDIYYGNWVRSVVQRQEICWLNHPTPAGAEVSGFGYFEPTSGSFSPPRVASEQTPASGLTPSMLTIIYDIYPHPSEHNGAFARQQYLDFLGRQGDDGGLRFWEDALNSGARQRTDLVELFLDSPEFGGTVAPVNRLYSAYFNRAPDRGGLFFWVDWIRSGRNLGQVSDEFARSDEFIATYGSLTDADFIDLVYTNVLGRSADAAGRAFWIDRLASGLTRGQLMVGFSESPEYIEQTRSAVLVESLYQGLLQRSPDPQGFDYWTGVADTGAPVTSLIAGMLSSDEYFDRFDGIYETPPIGGARLQHLHFE